VKQFTPPAPHRLLYTRALENRVKRDPRDTRACVAFLAGALILFGQYAYIRRVDEFYPSISLPGGPHKVEDGETRSRNQRRLFAVTADGERVRIDEHALLAMLPPQFRGPVIAKGFGLLPRLRKPHRETEEARAWLRQRLARQLGREDLVAIEITVARYAPRGPSPAPYPPHKLTRIDL
jgi:hypothetical protein